jgi:hypothetical protein
MQKLRREVQLTRDGPRMRNREEILQKKNTSNLIRLVNSTKTGNTIIITNLKGTGSM